MEKIPVSVVEGLGLKPVVVAALPRGFGRQVIIYLCRGSPRGQSGSGGLGFPRGIF